MNNTVKNILQLIKSAVTGEKAILSKDINWQDIYTFASAHRITTLIYYGIKNSEAELPKEIAELFKRKMYKSTVLSAENDYQLSLATAAFERLGIAYMPMKGLVVREFYPRPDMRTVGDADILIHPEQIASASKVLEEMGYTFVKESSHECVWQKKHTKIELHKKLIGNAFEEYSEYYDNTLRFFENSSDGTHLHKMTIDDLFVYLIVHIAKHYRNGGIGLRHFIDLYVIKNACSDLNDNYITGELTKMDLEKFYTNICDMLDVWFNNKKSSEVTTAMTVRVFESGIFGSSDNKTRARAANSTKKTPLLYKLFHAVFLPMSQMKQLYPNLEKAPILLPVFWIIRIFNLLLFKRNRIKKYANGIKLSTQSEADKFKDELKLVGF